jgi:PEP-CTERM motif
MRLLPLTSIALACALGLAAESRANDVTFTGFAHGSQTVAFSLVAPNAVASGTVSAGGFATILNGGPSFVSYCVDLYQHISFGTLYPEYGAPGTTHVFANSRAYADLGRLYANAGVVDTSVEEAAFQIAVWEIAYETTPGAYSLGSGAASFSGGSADSSGALALAATWLAGLGNGAGRSISVIESPDHQDVIFAPVPEPSTYMLMIAGLMATVEISRRKRKQA